MGIKKTTIYKGFELEYHMIYSRTVNKDGSGTITVRTFKDKATRDGNDKDYLRQVHLQVALKNNPVI